MSDEMDLDSFVAPLPDDVLADRLHRAEEMVRRGNIPDNAGYLESTGRALLFSVAPALAGPNVNEDLDDLAQYLVGIFEELPLIHERDFNKAHFDQEKQDLFKPKSTSNESAIKKVLERVTDPKRKAKSKGDIRPFISFAGKVWMKWKEEGGRITIPHGSPSELLLSSLREFVAWLEENEPNEDGMDSSALKYKFTYRSRMAWVLENAKKFSSVAEICRMLILCSVVRCERGRYGQRENGPDE